MSLQMAPAKPVVLCAATSWEARPLARALRLLPTSSAGAWKGAWGGRPVVLLQTGMGGPKAAEAISRLGATFSSFDVISTGFAGALRRDLKPGHLILDIGDPDLASRALRRANDLGLSANWGILADSDAVVSRPADKLRLGRESGALAVDMETAALKAWARGRDCNVWAVRAVLDGVDDVLPPSAPRGRHPRALLAYAVAHIQFLRSAPALVVNRRKALASLTRFMGAFLSDLCR